MLHLGTSIAQLKKKKKKSDKITDIPSSFSRLLPLRKNPTTEFFSYIDLYYPISLYSSDDSTVNLPDAVCQMTVTFEIQDEIVAEIKTGLCSAISGTYWFRAVLPHAEGTLVLRFDCISDRDITPLVFRITTAGAREAKKPPIASVPQHAVASSNDGPILKSSKSNSLSTTDSAKSKKKVISNSEVHTKKSPEKVFSNANSVQISIAEPRVASSQSRLPSDIPVLPFPEATITQGFKALPRPLRQLSGQLIKPSAQALIIGSTVRVILSTALVNALLDDRANIQVYASSSAAQSSSGNLSNTGAVSVSSSSSASNSNSNSKKRRHEESHSAVPLHQHYPVALHSPNVHELLTRVENKIKGTDSYKESFALLRIFFETKFGDLVLYKEEKILLKTRLAQLKRSRTAFCESFGAVYLLRLIVAVATLAEEQFAEMLRAIDQAETATASDLLSPAAKRKKVQQEKQMLINNSKNFRQTAEKLNTALAFVVKELSDNAHFLF